MDIPQGGFSCPLFPSQIGIWTVFLPKEDNEWTQRKTLKARTRTNNKFNPHVMPCPGMETQVIVVGNKCSNLLLCHPYSPTINPKRDFSWYAHFSTTKKHNNSNNNNKLSMLLNIIIILPVTIYLPISWCLFQIVRVQVSISFSSVLSCEDLLISSFHHSANMWIFIYLNLHSLGCLFVPNSFTSSQLAC